MVPWPTSVIFFPTSSKNDILLYFLSLITISYIIVYFFAIKKDDYNLSKELFSELKKNKQTPPAVPLEAIDHSMSVQNKNDHLLNDVESKSKMIFGNLFSRKKE